MKTNVERRESDDISIFNYGDEKFLQRQTWMELGKILVIVINKSIFFIGK